MWRLCFSSYSSIEIIDLFIFFVEERDSADVLEVLLPIMLGLDDTITLSQTYVCMFVELMMKRLNDASVVDSPKRPSVSSVIAELLWYMVLAVPDTLVSLDCFPLPPFVVPDVYGRGALLKITSGGGIPSSKRCDAYRYFSCGSAVCSIQTHPYDLATVLLTLTFKHVVQPKW
jgi:hypothetical protein